MSDARGGPAAALRATLWALRCPVCAAPLSENDDAPPASRVRTLACPGGHRFDVARQGYVSLLAGGRRTGPGDDAAQLDRRESFLSAGHFEPVVEALLDALAAPLSGAPALLVDVGAGTGYYARRALEAAPGARAVCTEISTVAARRLARAHSRASAVVADTWHGLPLGDGVADALTVVFAPRNPAEFARVLAPDGRLVVVWPGPRHLHPLREELGMLGVEEEKEQRLAGALAAHFETLGEGTRVRATMSLDRGAALDVALMGPSGARIGEDALRSAVERLGGDAPTAEIDVHVSVFGHRSAQE